MKKEYIPNYFHIGLPKTGTTTIQDILSLDERINLYCKVRVFQTPAWYKKNLGSFFEESFSQITVFSDETFLRQQGNYFKNTISLERLSRMKPDARIIITIREQRSLLLSRYKHGIQRSNISCSFEEWLESTEGIDFLSLINYANLFKTITAFFPKKNIQILLFEDLINNYQTFFDRLYSIFNIDKPANLVQLKSNKSTSDSVLIIKRYLNRLNMSRDKKFSKKKLGDILHQKISMYFSNLVGEMTNPSSKIQWHDVTFLRNIEKEIMGSNKRFEDLTGIDLRSKGYLV